MGKSISPERSYGEMSKIAACAGFAATEGYRRVDHRSERREFGRVSLRAAVTRCP